ncbi:hypothetical protein MNBD_NITROSPINAE04-144 [hydrothermal vent metagenome]|uniref:Uncharacterized protein n=1 Tax=hydrothermal vent metagenome TaxID=652676 RepID=A0A3B1CMR3_9ZZZZ
MSCVFASMTPYKRVENWLEYELKIISGEKKPPNKFELFVPMEVREEFRKRAKHGSVMRVTKRSLKVWAAIAEVSGCGEFKEPLGWSRADIKAHLLLEKTGDERTSAKMGRQGFSCEPI